MRRIPFDVAVATPQAGMPALQSRGITRRPAVIYEKMTGGLFQKLKWLFILWLARRLPDCKEMTRTLGESLDRRQSWREKLIMKLHLFTCDACERYLEQVSFLKDALHEHGERSPETSEFTAAQLSGASKARIKDLLRRQFTPAI